MTRRRTPDPYALDALSRVLAQAGESYSQALAEAGRTFGDVVNRATRTCVETLATKGEKEAPDV